MTTRPQLTIDELKKGINETKEALARGRELIKHATSAGMTTGLSQVVESTPKLMEKLEGELEKLKLELDTRSGASG